MDPSTVGLIFTLAWQGVVSTRADAAFVQACSMGIKALKRDGDKIFNYDLEKALYGSFLRAQETIAQECKEELERQERQREHFGNQRDIEQLIDKIQELKVQLKQIKKEGKPVGIPLQFLDEVELLLRPNSEFDPNRVQDLNKQKLQAVVLEKCPVDLYKAKVEQKLCKQVSLYFFQHEFNNPNVSNIFVGQSLIQLNVTVEQIKAQLEQNTQSSNVSLPPVEINWQQECRQLLEKKRLLTTSFLRGVDETVFELDEIYVLLGLVQLKPKSKRIKKDVLPEEGQGLYQLEDKDEIKRTYQHDEFFEEVLKRGQSENSQGRRIAIIGEPGAGKTTLLQKINFWVLDNTDGLPIWISLADLRGKSLGDYIREVWLPSVRLRVTPEMAIDLENQFTSGRVWLLLDGVDEMAVESGNPLAEIDKHLTGWIASARVGLSCRLNVWEVGKASLVGFDVFRNLDFEVEQVEQFIGSWFSKVNNPEQGQRLQEELKQPGKERIRDLIKNPLRLALLCRTWQSEERELPDTKAKLYTQFVETFYEWKPWTPASFSTKSEAKRRLNKALEQLALQAINSQDLRFCLRGSFVSSILGEPDEPLFKLALDLGWLNEVGVALENRREKIYAFFHPTFQEYFATRAIDDWHFFLNHIPDNPNHPDANYRIFEPQWKEVILLWLGRPEDEVPKQQKEDFIKALVEFEDGFGNHNFYGYRAYFLAGAGTAEFSECSRADKIVAKLTKWSFAYFDSETQRWLEPWKAIAEEARAALLETDCTRAIKSLIKLLLLQSTSRESIQDVLKILEEIGAGNSTVIEALIDLLRNTQAEVARLQGHLSLKEIEVDDPPSNLNKLYNELDLSTAKHQCWEIAETLGKIDPGSSETIKALIELLLHTTEDYHLRQRVAESLEEINPGNSTLIDWLIGELHQEDFYEGYEEDLACCKNRINILIELLQTDKDKQNHQKVADRLGKINLSNPGAITSLIKLVHTAQEESGRLFNSVEINLEDPFFNFDVLIDRAGYQDICRDVLLELAGYQDK